MRTKTSNQSINQSSDENFTHGFWCRPSPIDRNHSFRSRKLRRISWGTRSVHCRLQSASREVRWESGSWWGTWLCWNDPVPVDLDIFFEKMKFCRKKNAANHFRILKPKRLLVAHRSEGENPHTYHRHFRPTRRRFQLEDDNGQIKQRTYSKIKRDLWRANLTLIKRNMPVHNNFPEGKTKLQQNFAIRSKLLNCEL